MNSLPSVLITSVGSGVGYGVLHALRCAGRTYKIIGANSVTRAAGIYRCDVAYQLPGVHHPDQDRQQLYRILARERPDMVVAGHDLEMPLLAMWRQEIEETFQSRVLVSSPSVVSACNDKLQSAKLLSNYFASTRGTSEDFTPLIQECGFPLIVKPRFGYASRGVQILFNESELDRAISHGQRDNLIVQEYVLPEIPRER